MPFTVQDRIRLVDALKLTTAMDESTSPLQSLMTDLDRRDAQNGSDRATQIQALLSSLETLQASLDDTSTEALQADSIQEFHHEDYFRIQFRGDINSTAGATSVRKAKELRQRIRRLIDPHGYLQRYTGVGRAIDG